MLDVEDIFAELHAVACERLGEEFFVDLGIGDPEEFPEARNMAYTARNKRGDICIVVAPKLVVCDDEDRVQGVLRHEFGHAALWHMEPSIDRALKLVKEGKFTPEDYGPFSMMKHKGSEMSKLGTFEGKVPAAIMTRVKAREADILSGKFVVKVDDTQPKSTAR